jgi:hypothetical protein
VIGCGSGDRIGFDLAQNRVKWRTVNKHGNNPSCVREIVSLRFCARIVVSFSVVVYLKDYVIVAHTAFVKMRFL